MESTNPDTLSWHTFQLIRSPSNSWPNHWSDLFDRALADRHAENRECMHQKVVATVVGRFKRRAV